MDIMWLYFIHHISLLPSHHLTPSRMIFWNQKSDHTIFLLKIVNTFILPSGERVSFLAQKPTRASVICSWWTPGCTVSHMSPVFHQDPRLYPQEVTDRFLPAAVPHGSLLSLGCPLLLANICWALIIVLGTCKGFASVNSLNPME